MEGSVREFTDMGRVIIIPQRRSRSSPSSRASSTKASSTDTPTPEPPSDIRLVGHGAAFTSAGIPYVRTGNNVISAQYPAPSRNHHHSLAARLSPALPHEPQKPAIADFLNGTGRASGTEPAQVRRRRAYAPRSQQGA